jgi:hypothetical protein
MLSVFQSYAVLYVIDAISSECRPVGGQPLAKSDD